MNCTVLCCFSLGHSADRLRLLRRLLPRRLEYDSLGEEPRQRQQGAYQHGASLLLLLQRARPRLRAVRGGLRGQERGGVHRRAGNQFQEKRWHPRRDCVCAGNGTDRARRDRMPLDERSQETACVPAVLLKIYFDWCEKGYRIKCESTL